MNHYTPSLKPKAAHLASVGRVIDELEDEEIEQWLSACSEPDYPRKMLSRIGSFQAVEVDGDLHVHGDLDIVQHRIAALRIKGDLIVDGVYGDQAHPEAFVLVEGSLKAKHIITGAHLEVRGDVEAHHLAGDYNDFGARFMGETKATTFYPETHHFEFGGATDFALELGSERSDSMDLYSTAFVSDEYLDDFGGVKNRGALITALARGHEILRADPRNPSEITKLTLVERNFDRLPQSLFRFENLESLVLDYNKLTSLAGLRHLSKLSELSVVGNPLEELSKELLALPLRKLNLGYWLDLPTWFSQLKHLEELQIVVEEVTAIPPAITALPNLRRLELADWPDDWEPLLGDLVSSLPSLSVRELSISCALITRFPNDLAPFSGLQVLECSGLSELDAKEQRRITNALPSVQVRFHDAESGVPEK